MIHVPLASTALLDPLLQLTVLQEPIVTISMVKTFQTVVYAPLVLSAHILEPLNHFLVDQVNSVLRVPSSSLTALEERTILASVCTTQESAHLVMLVISVQ